MMLLHGRVRTGENIVEMLARNACQNKIFLEMDTLGLWVIFMIQLSAEVLKTTTATEQLRGTKLCFPYFMWMNK